MNKRQNFFHTLMFCGKADFHSANLTSEVIFFQWDKFSRRVSRFSSLTAEVRQHVNAYFYMNHELWRNKPCVVRKPDKTGKKKRWGTNFFEDVQAISRSDTRLIFWKFSFNSGFLRHTKISIIVTLTKNCIAIIDMYCLWKPYLIFVLFLFLF